MVTSSAFITYVLTLPRVVKRVIAVVLDVAMCVFSVWLSFYLRLGEPVSLTGAALGPTLVSIGLALPIFVTSGFYRAIFRYEGWAAMLTIGRATVIYAVPFALTYTTIGVAGVPRTIGLIQPILLFLLIGGARALTVAILGETYRSMRSRDGHLRVLIYGAGAAGRQLAGAIRSSGEMRVVGFVDDDPALWQSTMNGLPIFGPHQLEKVARRRAITDILLAIPSATRARRTEIVKALKHLGLHVRTLPGVIDIVRGRVTVNDLKDLDIEDLLGRAPVPPDLVMLRRHIEGKVVLVTGAGGSIGSELCRQIVRNGPALVLLVDLSEYNLYSIHQELMRLVASDSGEASVLIPLIASVCDARRMTEIFATWRPETIYHAAAYKHVPLVEHNAVEGIRNNVIGTLTIAKLAREYSAANFVLISTDKAVRPTNIMGTSKRLAEMILQALAAESDETCYSMVRFGNVLGSSGSVVPLFRAQIAAGGPITITHREITRYFMTIPEAAELVLQAGAMAEGGDVFVLNMGESVKIVDLARNMIELSGLTVRDEENPTGDIEIRTVGLRPGEKLYEELLIGEDPIGSGHERIFRSLEHFLSWRELGGYLASLNAALDAGDAVTARALLRQIVPEYRPHATVVDWVSQARMA